MTGFIGRGLTGRANQSSRGFHSATLATFVAHCDSAPAGDTLPCIPNRSRCPLWLHTLPHLENPYGGYPSTGKYGALRGTPPLRFCSVQDRLQMIWER